MLEYTGSVIRAMSMESRMTICNMSIEAGARAGLISPDEKTFEYLKGPPCLPQDGSWEYLIEHWKGFASDGGCSYDRLVELDGADIEPQVTWGTSPGMVSGVNGRTPVLSDIGDAQVRESAGRALAYMGLDEGVPMQELTINKMFLGSCTNGRAAGGRGGRRFRHPTRSA